MPNSSPIWLFDSHCILCSGAVQYMLANERDHDTRFVAIQSDEGRALAERYGLDADNPDSFVFIENDRAHQKSDGVAALSRHLNGPGRLLEAGKILPKCIRDRGYNMVAKNRYKLFGRSDTCMVPNADQRARFVLPDD